MITEKNDRIVSIANALLDKEDVTDLLNFRDEEFEEIRIGVGWDKEIAWKSYMVELIWRECFKINELDRLFNCGSLATWYSFRKSTWIVGESPRVGATFIWQEYKEGLPRMRSGAGIVTSIEENYVKVIEGAVKDDKLIVIEKVRNLNYSLMNGERPKGFIYPNKAVV